MSLTTVEERRVISHELSSCVQIKENITIVFCKMEEVVEAKEVKEVAGPLQKVLSHVKKTKLSEIEFILFGNFDDFFANISCVMLLFR